jgi:hypothetical protein
LALAGNTRTFAESEIRTISRHGHASLAAGAAWGLGIGAGVGFALAYKICRNDNSSCAGAGTRGALATGGVGAGVGVLISALIPTRRLIYSRLHGSATLTVSPLLTRERRGISVLVSAR